MRLVLCGTIFFWGTLLCDSTAIDTSKWHGRSIYFVVTDRFAKSEAGGDVAPKCDGMEWCGGTLRGVQRKLDYIQNMGFDAIWITPVVKQVDWRDNWNGTGYHGYWAADFMKLDPHLGTEADLLALRQDCTNRGMLLMLDVVANHVGPIHSIDQVKLLGPQLNSPTLKQFHKLGRKVGESLESYIRHPVTMNDAGDACWPNYDFANGCNYTVILEGWFGDLADLRQENPETRDYLLHWIQYMVKHYGVDGLRLDTALYMPKWFLESFQQAAGVYMIGEVVTYNISMHRSFTPPLSGLLNFPIATQLNRIFSSNGSLSELQYLLEQQNAAAYPDMNLLGNFIDNHDGDRFLYNHSGNTYQVKNSLAWTLLYHGLPITYYGTEQVEVSNQKDFRTSMWPHYEVTEMYHFIAKLNQLRRSHGLAPGGRDVTTYAKVLAAENDYLAFVRGSLLVLVTNIGVGGTSLKVCLSLDLFRDYWSSACSAKHVKTVLGNVPDPECESGKVCMQIENGLPSVFAIADKSSFVV